MDRIDKRILELLQRNSKLSNQELAEKISLSPSPCLRRVKQLEEAGYIERYAALLNPQKLGLGLTIVVSVGLISHDAELMAEFERTIQGFPEIVQCVLIAGQSQDYLLKVTVPGLDDYQVFLLKKLTQVPGVKNIHSSFVLRDIVDNPVLPLSHL